MANIFISYSSDDKTIVKKMAALLERQGWTVWWDREIPVGKNFDVVIETELDSADCVLVIWTARSIASEWVRAEAGEANRQKKLVPIFLEEVEAPLAFRNIESALLFNWNGNEEHLELPLLFKAISNLIGGTNPLPPPPPPPPPPPFFKRYRIHAVVAAIMLAIIGIVIYQTKSTQKTDDHLITVSGIVKTAAEIPIADVEVNVEGTKYGDKSKTDGSYRIQVAEFAIGDEITISTSHPKYEDKFFFFKIQSKEVNDMHIYLNPNSP